MKTQKILFSAVLVFAGILLFAKTTRLNSTVKNAEVLKVEAENIKALSSLEVVWHDHNGNIITTPQAETYSAVTAMPYASKEQYTYNFETKTVSKKLYAQIELKKIWHFKAEIQ